MQTDAYFTIGHAHLGAGKPCQDYATAARLPGGGAYAIVSDGCSSGGETDVGARIVALSAAQAIREHWAIRSSPEADDATYEIATQQRATMVTASTILGCDHSDLLATRIYAYLGRDAGYFNIQGDGVIAFRYADGSVFMLRTDWHDNLPFYPAYTSDNYAGFIAAHGGDTSRPCLERESIWITPDGTVTAETLPLTLAKGISGFTLHIASLSLFESVAVFTDGVTQIEGVDWQDAVVELLNFKTTKGAFAKRRMIRFLKDALGFGRGPMDDIAYAVIRIPQEKESDEA